jgi:hypothetical protein
VTSRLAVTARIDPSSTPGIKATAAPQPPLGSGIATVPQPERLDGMSNPRQEQAEIHQGLLFRSRDRPLFFYRHGPHNSSSNDQRAQRGNATRGAIHAVRLSSRTSIPSPSGTGSQGFATHLASGDLAMFYFRGPSLSREATGRREAHPPTVRTADRPASSTIRRKKKSRAAT